MGAAGLREAQCAGGAGMGLGMLSGSCSRGIMLWGSCRRAGNTLPLGTPPPPLPFSQALRKFLAWEIWGSWAFFLIIIFRNVEMADKHNKSFHVLVPTVPALCLGDPEVSAPTLSQPCRVLGVMCRALQAGR